MSYHEVEEEFFYTARCKTSGCTWEKTSFQSRKRLLEEAYEHVEANYSHVVALTEELLVGRQLY